MAEQYIDQLARAVVAGLPRRRLITALVVGLAASPANFPRSVTAAACKKVGRKCERTSDCCAHAECPGNKCRCRSGFRECDRQCVNSDTDKDHCGQCDNRCGADERCCDGDCANLDRDPNHCRACGSRCGEDEECVGGNCLPPAAGCPAGFDGCAGGGQSFCGSSNNCRCHQSTEGATVCIDPLTPGLACDQCTVSTDCAAFGANAVCVQTVPGGSCCSLSGGNFCARTCAA